MISAKYASLIAGVLQQALLVVIIRYSRTLHIAGGQQDTNVATYLTSVVVTSSEVLKIVLNGILEVINDPPSSDQHDSDSSMGMRLPKSKSFGKKSFRVLKRLFNVCNKESAKLIVPAALYLLQNNLLFVALANLSVPTYQLTNQGKLLITAIISRIVLKKRINGMQYLSIALLGLGVAVTHLSEYYQNMNQQAESASLTSTETVLVQNQWLGLASVMISCVTSGFASVYFELILKTKNKSKQSVHFKNFQLAVWSFLLAAIHIICSKDLPLILKHGLFHGFDGVILMVVVAQTMTGFVVSMMLYYADSILKGFAVSVAAVLATVVSVFVFGTKINELFFAGASLVGIAVAMYSFYEKKNVIASSPFHKKSLLPVSSTTKNRMHRHIPLLSLLLLCLISSLCFAMSVLSRADSMDLRNIDDISGDKNGDHTTPTLPIVSGDKNGDHTTPTLPICTKKAFDRPRPKDVSREQYRKVVQSADVTAYIVDELKKKDVPVTLMYGSMLHEYRNGTGPCHQADFKDKDLDIAVFAKHFPLVLAMTDEIEKKFGWHLKHVEKERMVLFLLPPQQKVVAKGFQIDVYGFECNSPSKGLIHFPWDRVSVAMNLFLPLTKHKMPVYHDNAKFGELPYLHTPLNPPCLLANMYGSDFMTPRKGKKSQKAAYDEPTQECMNTTLTSDQHKELQRQLSFCE